MEGVPFFPESGSDDDEESSIEKKDKRGSKDKKLSLFEKLNPEKNPDKSKDDKSEKKDKEIPLEKLSDDEKQLIVTEIVVERKQDVKQELESASPDTSEEQESLMSATFLETLDAEVNSGVPLEVALDNAEEKTLAITGIESADETLDETAVGDIKELPDNSADPKEAEIELDDPLTVVPSLVAGGGGTPPPRSPVLPTPTGQLGSSPVRPVGIGATPLGGVRSPLVTPNVLVVPDRRRERANLLVGGMIGYLIGRRRGRIKTEKHLLPIKKKLEKEVIELEQTIIDREERLRKLARSKYERQPTAVLATVERMQKLQQLKQSETRQGVVAKNPEKIGKFAVLAERPTIKSSEKLKSVELMTTQELLSIAVNIKIEQTTVAKLYESNMLDQEGLRRIVRAYQRGDKYEKLIKDNLISPEFIRNLELLNDQFVDRPEQKDQIIPSKERLDKLLQVAGIKEESSQLYGQNLNPSKSIKSTFIMPYIAMVIIIILALTILIFAV